MADSNPVSTNKPQLTPPAITSFNIKGLAPNACTFDMTIADFQRNVLEIAKTYISDFRECTYERGHEGHDACLLWIPANSTHLINKGSVEGTVLKRAIREQSHEMQEFIKKFCTVKTSEGTFLPRDRNYQYGIIQSSQFQESPFEAKAVCVNPWIFVDIMFDRQGYAYKKAYDGVRNIPTKISFEHIHARGRDGKPDPRGRLIGVRIKKYTPGTGQRELRTKFAVR